MLIVYLFELFIFLQQFFFYLLFFQSFLLLFFSYFYLHLYSLIRIIPLISGLADDLVRSLNP
ncbi:MAG: hypothetical protein CVV37_06235 [Nitrospira bacterium HGW-Nitrospira-1]|nr:MAG: hypothetical protein CVV37_06235 [Nitrospira bacterium HGW-Nitrospira-1]